MKRRYFVSFVRDFGPAAPVRPDAVTLDIEGDFVLDNLELEISKNLAKGRPVLITFFKELEEYER